MGLFEAKKSGERHFSGGKQWQEAGIAGGGRESEAVRFVTRKYDL